MTQGLGSRPSTLRFSVFPFCLGVDGGIQGYAGVYGVTWGNIVAYGVIPTFR